jgi:hypothetical protein
LEGGGAGRPALPRPQLRAVPAAGLRGALVAFLERNVVDFVVVDEIHYAKQREAGAEMSKRKRLVQGLILEAAKKNAAALRARHERDPRHQHASRGQEPRRDDHGTSSRRPRDAATVQNCMRLYQRLVTLGTRWKPDYKIQLDVVKEEIDCGADLDEIREVGRGTVLELEQVLTRLRLPTILENIAPGEKVLVYTHLSAVSQGRCARHRGRGLPGGAPHGRHRRRRPERVPEARRQGRRAHRVEPHRHGRERPSVRLPKAHHQLLPWTNAEYEQLVGRLYRQGSQFDNVRVIIPVTFAMVNGERWSYCESKLHRLEYKKSIADAAVDGVVPEGNLRTATQAQQDIMGWLARLETATCQEVVRPEIKIPLSGEPAEVARGTLATATSPR